MNPEDLLTLADRTEYYQRGAEPWDKVADPRPPEKLSPDMNKAHDNIRRLLRENDVLIANQFKLRKAQTKLLYLAGLAILAAWTPLWVPLILHWAGK